MVARCGGSAATPETRNQRRWKEKQLSAPRSLALFGRPEDSLTPGRGVVSKSFAVALAMFLALALMVPLGHSASSAAEPAAEDSIARVRAFILQGLLAVRGQLGPTPGGSYAPSVSIHSGGADESGCTGPALASAPVSGSGHFVFRCNNNRCIAPAAAAPPGDRRPVASRAVGAGDRSRSRREPGPDLGQPRPGLALLPAVEPRRLPHRRDRPDPRRHRPVAFHRAADRGSAGGDCRKPMKDRSKADGRGPSPTPATRTTCSRSGSATTASTTSRPTARRARCTAPGSSRSRCCASRSSGLEGSARAGTVHCARSPSRWMPKARRTAPSSRRFSLKTACTRGRRCSRTSRTRIPGRR